MRGAEKREKKQQKKKKKKKKLERVHCEAQSTQEFTVGLIKQIKSRTKSAGEVL